MTFIQEIIAHLGINAKTETRKLIFLFPSKRPAVYLKQELSKQIEQPLISPKCLAIADFITEHSQLTMVDSMTLVFELYQCYLSQITEGQKALSLLEFYPLGETLVADFGDIDKDMVDAKALFSNFRQLKEIEDEFAFEDEQLENFRNFWKHFSSKEPQKMQVEFLDLWNMMGALYFEFRTRLQASGKAYAGLAERNMAENFSEIISDFDGKKIAICGFNALTKAEVKLFKELETVAEVLYFFDFDEHYMQPHHEAGHFMRRNRKAFKLQSSSFKVSSLKSKVQSPRFDVSSPKPKVQGSSRSETIDEAHKLSKTEGYRLSEAEVQNLLSNKQLHITAASGVTGMVQALYHDINQLDPTEYNSKTGVILPDENALRACIEVLPSLPINLNVTMGMPIQSTSIWSLVKALFLLQGNYKSQTKSFLYRDVLNVLQHPELAMFQSEKSQKLQKHIARQNMVYCSANWLQKQDLPPVFNSIFSAVNNSVFAYVQNILALIEKEQDHEDNIKASILVNVFQQCVRFSDLYQAYLDKAEVSEMWTLFKKATKTKSISFEGEPIEGVQLMGLLESRAIDFDRLFVLSVNEGIIPKSSKHQSLIPFGIRKAFGMNTFKEDDAMSAYYFYRMLQRAAHINLYYNSDTDGESKGEQSRYILQIEQELPNFSITKTTFSLHNETEVLAHLSVAKTHEVIHSLSQYEVVNDAVKRPLSPSALTTFIKSPIQFYLRYVANFKERDEVLEEMDPITLGNIVHNTLEELYTPFLNTEIDHLLVDKLINDQLQETLEKYLVKEMNLQAEELEGRNLLFYNICRRLCINVLRADAKTNGLKIQALEFDELFYDIEISTHEGPKTIRLKGQFDRLDEVDEQIRVVDYKTGKVEIPKKWEDAISKGFEDGKFSATLQTLFYTLVYLKNYPSQSVVPVIYHLKSTGNLVRPVVENPTNLDQLTEFENLLKDKLEEIWNSEKPFEFDDYEEESKYLMMGVL